MPKGVPADIPNRQQLRHWETVCRFLDAQPFRAIAYPFPRDPPISTRLLKRMARFQLVLHRDDCRWQLSRRWQALLTRLWSGVAEEETSEPGMNEELPGQPFITDRGVDTLYANLLSPDGLPARLIAACDALKAKAQDEDTTVETPWSVLGAPLSIFKAGKGTSGGGRGVSWSYILRNAMVMLVLRKTPLNRLLGSVRFSAEALWTLGPRAALDGAQADLRHLWSWAGEGEFEAVRWQLSQIHLCVDVAHFAPTPADLNRLLCRSLKKIVHLPSSADVDAALMADEEGDLAAQDAAWLAGVVPPEWESVPLAAYDLADLALLDANESDADDDTTVDDDALALADEQGASVHLWGQRASGFAFSPGADLSAAWYDKVLQERQSGKRWMEAIHRAGGWDTCIPLFRVEARFRRGVLREFTPAHGLANGESGEPVDWFEDPWTALDHLDDLWAYFAGLPPEADTAPDVIYRGWMRLAVPDQQDSNRSRWLTDPIWLLIQRAVFTAAATPIALTRHPKVAHDVDQVDAELYGLLKLRAALRGEYLDTTTTLSLELRAFASRMEEVDAERERDFAEEVREKARMLGKPLPPRSTTVLAKQAPRHITQSPLT